MQAAFDIFYTCKLQPLGLIMRSVDAGYWLSFSVGRRGRATNSPPQFGHWPCSVRSAHVAQKVHSNEHIRACGVSGGKFVLQHSQFGRNASMGYTFFVW